MFKKLLFIFYLYSRSTMFPGNNIVVVTVVFLPPTVLASPLQMTSLSGLDLALNKHCYWPQIVRLTLLSSERSAWWSLLEFFWPTLGRAYFALSFHCQWSSSLVGPTVFGDAVFWLGSFVDCGDFVFPVSREFETRTVARLLGMKKSRSRKKARSSGSLLAAVEQGLWSRGTPRPSLGNNPIALWLPFWPDFALCRYV